MSGDHGPRECVAGALLAVREDPALHALLVGQPEHIQPHLSALPTTVRAQIESRIEVIPAQQVVPMDQLPREAVRRGRDSSMRVAIDLVKDERAAACVSAGNTGALTAMSHFVLKTIANVERAAIMSAVPSAHGHTHMLDLGATTRASPEQLVQFASMGSIVARDVYSLERPRIGLLNIGEEDIKGHDVVRSAHALLAHSSVNYVGFVEGDDIFSGRVDVVVTDGFTGNVALKTMEGLAKLVIDRLRTEFRSSLRSRLAGWVARPVLKRTALALDPRGYNGACMVGLRGVVVKSHGRADRVAFARAVQLAALVARRGLTTHIARAFEAQGS